MIRNIVFDMGNVLIRFDPDRFMDKAGVNGQADRDLIRMELFQSVEWAQMDLGVLREETAEPLVLDRIPERLRDTVSGLIRHWADDRETIPGMTELLKELKGSGYALYLLSNASVMQHQYWPRFEMSRLFDGKMSSCDLGIVKPDPRIYRCFTEAFGLKPEECLFVDDQTANVAAAVNCGWSGIVFHGDERELRKKLLQYGISVNCREA